eukprot:TRINITY_DN1540_c0_g1_i3.p2 TRINITY_DN1540_c0_g1~~TRINITY_DN1540_c0_g1_i3.p2  ORF type:complete len:374 (-),score=66.56 TRINITY_DN1540_c0_g1_i3:1214-2311(-)
MSDKECENQVAQIDLKRKGDGELFKKPPMKKVKVNEEQNLNQHQQLTQEQKLNVKDRSGQQVDQQIQNTIINNQIGQNPRLKTQENSLGVETCYEAKKLSVSGNPQEVGKKDQNIGGVNLNEKSNFQNQDGKIKHISSTTCGETSDDPYEGLYDGFVQTGINSIVDKTQTISTQNVNQPQSPSKNQNGISAVDQKTTGNVNQQSSQDKTLVNQQQGLHEKQQEESKQAPSIQPSFSAYQDKQRTGPVEFGLLATLNEWKMSNPDKAYSLRSQCPTGSQHAFVMGSNNNRHPRQTHNKRHGKGQGKGQGQGQKQGQRSQRGDKGRRAVCKYWNMGKNCWKGQQCPFLHEGKPAVSVLSCRELLKGG